MAIEEYQTSLASVAGFCTYRLYGAVYKATIAPALRNWAWRELVDDRTLFAGGFSALSTTATHVRSATGAASVF